MIKESIRHKELKLKARDILLRMGFEDKEIFFEYKINLGNNKHYRVDVIGIKENDRVIIECGHVNKKIKLEELKLLGDKFIHLKYEREEGKITFALEIDERLWDKFKSRVSRNITLNQAIIKLIEQEVNGFYKKLPTIDSNKEILKQIKEEIKK